MSNFYISIENESKLERKLLQLTHCKRGCEKHSNCHHSSPFSPLVLVMHSWLEHCALAVLCRCRKNSQLPRDLISNRDTAETGDRPLHAPRSTSSLHCHAVAPSELPIKGPCFLAFAQFATEVSLASIPLLLFLQNTTRTQQTIHNGNRNRQHSPIHSIVPSSTSD
jgi:hypothetical protein